MIDIRTWIEKNGEQVEFGSISGPDVLSAVFRYQESYLNSSESKAVSISLPLQKEAFTPGQTRNFFEGLLPEGFTRRTVASWMRVDELDYLSILTGLGNECIGAIRICRAGEQPPVAGYEKLSARRVKELAAEGATKSAEIVTEAHLSLAGASGKIGLFYHEGQWYLPKGSAPSTHIVKQSHVRYESIVVNEQLSLSCAGKMGIEVPKSFIINVGDASDKDVLFASERYDRVFENAGHIDGLPCPNRLHQEDFAQALGIASIDKYESDPSQDYLARMFELLRKYSANPIEDQLKLWEIVVYNYLLGNTDSHIKNYALLYGRDLNGIRLAPAYDILSTCVYDGCTRNLPYSVNGKYNILEITREDFERTAARCGISRKIAMKRFDDLSENFEKNLLEAAAQLKEIGFQNVDDICRRILSLPISARH